MVCTFIDRYPNLFTFTGKELDTIYEEFLDYQAMSGVVMTPLQSHITEWIRFGVTLLT